MSGGVDSAVAAARAVDAGHDVTGVHLALARNPQTYRTGARGCCTLEDSRDARRAADVHRHPVLRLGHGRASSTPTWSTTSSPSTPPAARPTRACAATRRSSSRRCWTGRSRSASTRWSPATTPGSAPTGCCAAASTSAKDQSYVLAVLTREQLAHAMFPLGDIDQGRRCAPRPRERGLAVADKPDSHDICFIADGDTRRFLAERLGAAPGDDRRRATGAVLGAARRRVRLHRRPAQGPRPRRPGAGRPPALRAVDHAGDQHGDGRAGRGAGGRRRSRRRVRCGRRSPPAAADRVRGAAAGARRAGAGHGHASTAAR